MIALAWVLGSIAAYFAIGYVAAMWDRPHLYDRIRDTYPGKNKVQCRDLARGVSTATLMLWPLRLPYLFMANAVDKRDPDMVARVLARREEEIREREQAIRRLERQMQVGKAGVLPPPSPDSLRPEGYELDGH